jgi:hypothetical protein
MGYLGSTTALGVNGVYTSPVLMTDRADNISGSVLSDQSGTIFIEQSGDGKNWDISTSYPVTANTGKGFSESLYLPYLRVRYVNGSTAQGTFRIFARFTSAGEST